MQRIVLLIQKKKKTKKDLTWWVGDCFVGRKNRVYLRSMFSVHNPTLPKLPAPEAKGKQSQKNPEGKDRVVNS